MKYWNVRNKCLNNENVLVLWQLCNRKDMDMVQHQCNPDATPPGEEQDECKCEEAGAGVRSVLKLTPAKITLFEGSPDFFWKLIVFPFISLPFPTSEELRSSSEASTWYKVSPARLELFLTDRYPVWTRVCRFRKSMYPAWSTANHLESTIIFYFYFFATNIKIFCTVPVPDFLK